MGRRLRGALTLGLAALAAASCSILAPLDGLTGGAAQTDDAALPGDAAGEHAPVDALAEQPGSSDAADEVDARDAAESAPDATPDVTVDTKPEATPDAPVDSVADVLPDAPSSVYATAVLADAPLAYWRLGEKSGTVAHDATGHGHDGSYTGTYTLGVAGALVGDPDTAVQLDGVTGQVDVGDELDFTGQVPFSFEAWVKPAAIDSVYRHIVAKMAYNASLEPVEGTYVLLHQGATTLGFERWDDAGPVLTVETAVFPAVNSWAYVVATYDGATGILYVNGTAAQSSASTGGVQANGVHMLWGNVMEGVLDEIAVYDHALTPTRVTAHWNAAQ